MIELVTELEKLPPSIALAETIKDAKHIIYVLVDNIKKSDDTARQKAQRISREIIPYIFSIQSELEKSHFVKEVAKLMDLREEALWEEVKVANSLNANESQGEKKDFSKDEKVVRRIRPNISKQIVALLLWQESSKDKKIDVKELRERLEEILGKENLEKVC